LSEPDVSYLDRLLSYAVNQLCKDFQVPEVEGYAYAQHYGLFTWMIDFTSSIEVAAHFSVGAEDSALDDGCILRADVSRLASHLDLLRPTRLARAFGRPFNQSAWTIEPPYAVNSPDDFESDESAQYRNLKSQLYREGGVFELFVWKRGPEDDLRRIPNLECPPDDPYTGFMVLMVNEFVSEIERRPMSSGLADILLSRLPLYKVVGAAAQGEAPTQGLPRRIEVSRIDPRYTWSKRELRDLWTSRR
jgi:hypothetical protein